MNASAWPVGNSIKVSRDDRDWLLELGRLQGESRIMSTRHPTAQGLIKQFRPPIGDALLLPWASTKEIVQFVRKKVTVWSGPSFAGKTAFLRQLMLHALDSGHRVLFISLEETPEEAWREFMCTACVTRTPTPNQVEWCLDMWDERLFLFDTEEMIEPTLLFGIIRFACQQHGITHVVIDSLMRLAIRTDDYDGQREMGNMMGRLVKLADIHLHLVAHPRKTVSSRTPMDMYDIRGAQDIIAQADAIMTMERKHGEPYDNLLTCWKQRGDVNWIGCIQLHYEKNSRQLLISKFDDPVRYLPKEAYQ